MDDSSPSVTLTVGQLREIIREKILLIASPSEEDLMVIHKYKLVYPGVRLIQDW